MGIGIAASFKATLKRIPPTSIAIVLIYIFGSSGSFGTPPGKKSSGFLISLLVPGDINGSISARTC